MIENGLYIVTESGVQFLKKNNCQIVNGKSKLDDRPMCFALKDIENPEICYLIPLSTIKTDDKRKKIEETMSSKGIKANFYTIGKVDKAERVFKISSVFVVKESMTREWIKGNTIYTIKNKKLIEEVNTKLQIMLNHYKNFPHFSENHVIELKKDLIQNY